MSETNTQRLLLASEVRKLATALQAAAKAAHIEAFAMANPRTADNGKVWPAGHEQCTAEASKWQAQNPMEGFVPAAVAELNRIGQPIGAG